MPVITCIEDLKQPAPEAACRRCSGTTVRAGSYTEQTFRENTSDFSEDSASARSVAVRPVRPQARVSTMIGQKVTMPVGALRLSGSTGMQHADGEILAARAAAKFGVPFTLSTMSISSDRGRSRPYVEAPFWFQLYVMNDEDFVDRASSNALRRRNARRLVLTLDLQIMGQRHKDLKNGLTSTAETDAAEYPEH